MLTAGGLPAARGQPFLFKAQPLGERTATSRMGSAAAGANWVVRTAHVATDVSESFIYLSKANVHHYRQANDLRAAVKVLEGGGVTHAETL